MDTNISGVILLGIFFVVAFGMMFIVGITPTIYDKAKELGNLKQEVITSESGKVLFKITDDEVRELLLEMLKITITKLKEEYTFSNLTFKKMFYEIGNDLKQLQSKVEKNKLEEIDIEKLNLLISIFSNDVSWKGVCEKVMFEWDKKYIQYRHYGESPFYRNKI